VSLLLTLILLLLLLLLPLPPPLLPNMLVLVMNTNATGDQWLDAPCAR